MISSQFGAETKKPLSFLEHLRHLDDQHVITSVSYQQYSYAPSSISVYEPKFLITTPGNFSFFQFSIHHHSMQPSWNSNCCCFTMFQCEVRSTLQPASAVMTNPHEDVKATVQILEECPHFNMQTTMFPTSSVMLLLCIHRGGCLLETRLQLTPSLPSRLTCVVLSEVFQLSAFFPPTPSSLWCATQDQIKNTQFYVSAIRGLWPCRSWRQACKPNNAGSDGLTSDPRGWVGVGVIQRTGRRGFVSEHTEVFNWSIYPLLAVHITELYLVSVVIFQDTH